MKKILLIALFINLTLIAQEDNKNKIQLQLEFKNKNSGTNDYEEQNDKGFISGIILGRGQEAAGVTKEMNWWFINSHSEYYWFKVKNPNSIVPPEEYMKLTKPKYGEDIEEIIVQYSYYPIMEKGNTDSLNLYCKYILYKKTSEISYREYKYDISPKEYLVKVPFAKKFTLDFWKDLFPQSQCLTMLSFVENSKKEPSKEKALPQNPIPENKLIEFTRESKFGKTKLIMGMELLRTDKKGEKILLKRLDYPLKSISKIEGDDDSKEFSTNLYSGSIIVPFELYNSTKNVLVKQLKKYRDYEINYGLWALPIKKDKTRYTFLLMLGKVEGNGRMIYTKQVELSLNEKIKIDLLPSHWSTEEIINGERVNVNNDEDYNKYVNDYIILSLESDK